MSNILIFNNLKYKYHYEIIESVIHKYNELLNIDKDKNDKLYITYSDKNVINFTKYITTKYPNILINKDIKNTKIDFIIHTTVYDRNFNNLNINNNSKQKYIAHEITDRLKTNPNVYFLTPLSKKNIFIADILPYNNEKKKSSIPIYIIQGNLNHGRRNLNLLIKILEQTYNFDFMIKLIGKGRIPRELIKYKNKIIVKADLSFEEFHKEFLDVYCILPLISKKTHPHYYTNKLTSTINYARGYKLKCLIDKDLQDIYNLPDVEIYNDINDIVKGFKNTLKEFYNQ
tara:strand:+ start:1867 stop:2724 length:858 start_codon:yes stop_codon:yes gene_type:complete